MFAVGPIRNPLDDSRDIHFHVLSSVLDSTIRCWVRVCSEDMFDPIMNLNTDPDKVTCKECQTKVIERSLENL